LVRGQRARHRSARLRLPAGRHNSW
jgi:hypothetical protein